MTDNELFAKALSFASEKHAKQSRQDGSPYIWHPLGVAKLVKDAGYGIPYQIAALLHDTLEDTDATEDEIAEFGEDVLNAVRFLTKKRGLSISDYVNSLLTNNIATVVKNFDIVYNCNDALNANVDWAYKYLLKSKDSYYGKFSAGADNAIKKNLALVQNIIAAEQERQQKMATCGSVPDLSRSDIRFYYDELARYYFCFYNTSKEYNHIWILTSDGWKFENENPMFDSQYSDDYDEVDLEVVKKKMAEFGFGM